MKCARKPNAVSTLRFHQTDPRRTNGFFQASLSIKPSQMPENTMAKQENNERPTAASLNTARLKRFGLWLAEWCSKWFPDALFFALIGILVVFAFWLIVGESPAQ